MGKIEDAIKKINVEIQKEPNEEVLAKIGEYIIDQITTEEVAEKILAEDAANVYIQDLPSFVALNKKYGGYEFYPLYVQDFAKLYIVDEQTE